MAPVFSKEAIFSGAVDYLCLVCEGYFTNELQVREHLSEVDHRSNLKEAEYVEKYKGECIRKVKKWYFCELCNALLSAIKVGLHVADPKHKNNKMQMINRDGDLVTISGNVAINEEAWHGLTGNSCTLCNIDFDDKATHMKDIDHIANLIQSDVTSLDNIIYRKVFDAFHCLTCNEAIAEIEGHIEDTKHMELFRQSFALIKQVDETEKKCAMDDKECGNVENEILTTESKVPNNVELLKQAFNANAPLCDDVDDKNNNDILDSIEGFQKHKINVNFETQTAICKQCSTDLEFNCKDIKEHIAKHKVNMTTNIAAKKTASPLLEKDNNNEKIDSKMLFSTPVHLKNNIQKNKECLTTKSKNPIKNDAYEKQNLLKDSKKCDSNVDSNLKKVKDNIKNNSPVNEKHIEQPDKTQHSNGIENVMKGSFGKKPYLQKVPSKYMVQELTMACSDSLSPECIINQQYCITFFSFVFCSIIGPKQLMCDICKEIQTTDNVMAHIKTPKHLRYMEEVNVIIHPDSEFIREIRMDQFHCGFCNIIELSWQEMENHLKSTGHKESKTASFWRLEIHLQKIKKLNMPQTRGASFGQSLKNFRFR